MLSMLLLRRLFSTGRKGRGGFVDKVRIYARGGAGGQGSATRGGTGGDGGNVILVCGSESGSLVELARHETKRFIGESGEHSSKGKLFGKRGEDTLVNVPAGTVVYNWRGHQVADLDHIGSQHVLVIGGEGGNHTTENFQGSRGTRSVFTLELKTIADVGMVGFPNAGKSTLLGALSDATPKIANYPFTTIRPQLGVVSHDNHPPITVADLPGLVEGAHSNVGMGHRFLRHVERTKVLLYVVDINGFQLSTKYKMRDAVETVTLLAHELEQYSTGLSQRTSVLVFNKIDCDGACEKMEYISTKLDKLSVKFDKVLSISATQGSGVSELRTVLMQSVNEVDNE